MTISTDLGISNSMSSFVPKYWLNWQILVAILINFVDKDRTSKVHIPVHLWFFISTVLIEHFETIIEIRLHFNGRDINKALICRCSPENALLIES